MDIDLIALVKEQLPYGTHFTVHNEQGEYVGSYTSNGDFRLIENKTAVLMDTTKPFDDWSNGVSVYLNGKFTFRINKT